MRRLALSAVLALACAVTPAFAQLTHQAVVTTGLENPLSFAQDPSQPNVQLVIEKAGRVRVIQSGLLRDEPFLDLSSKVLTTGENGVLGLAFAPNYASSRRVFVYYINSAGHTVVGRFLRRADDPLRADPDSEFDLVWSDGNAFIPQQAEDAHKGGHLAFGPDGMLYIGLGDGGGGNDPEHRSQDPSLLHGKMLRINVNVGDDDPEGFDIPADNPFVNQNVRPEIWAFGLRNPWRWSFDNPAHGGTGAMIIGDVGQGGWEEINYEPAGQGGRNYGWRNREGAHDYITELPPFSEPLIDPALEYSHEVDGTHVGASITGGFVYRGSALGPGYVGRYFFADFVRARVWSVRFAIDAGGAPYAYDLQDHTFELGPASDAIVSFGEDANGELYTVSLLGGVYRLAMASSGPSSDPGCSTPDPFASLGGGTCVNGGWLPPGVTPPAPSTPPPANPAPSNPPPPNPTPTPPAPPPAPTPTQPAPSTPPPANTGCTTPDPFVSMGGGTCYNGGWLPPGLAPPAPPQPSTPPPSTPPPGPPPASTCSTPDPFASLGGGTCYNGGWLPPGIAPPVSAPGPSAPPPASPPSNGGCSTPDPFVGIPGLIGLCVNGGWIPIAGGGIADAGDSAPEGIATLAAGLPGQAFAPARPEESAT
jgi:glucose/arabinose dehydrogenase